jgi:hypothetical protein
MTLNVKDGLPDIGVFRPTDSKSRFILDHTHNGMLHWPLSERDKAVLAAHGVTSVKAEVFDRFHGIWEEQEEVAT